MSESIIRGSFKFTRTAGAGDRQKVRSSLLQVAMFSDNSLVEQFHGVHAACTKLKMRMRGHLHDRVIDNGMLDKVNFHVLHYHRDDDTDVVRHNQGSQSSFENWMTQHVDIIVQHNGGNIKTSDIMNGVVDLMKLHPRQLIADEHNHLAISELKKLYPKYYPNLEEYWIEFSK